MRTDCKHYRGTTRVSRRYHNSVRRLASSADRCYARNKPLELHQMPDNPIFARIPRLMLIGSRGFECKTKRKPLRRRRFSFKLESMGEMLKT